MMNQFVFRMLLVVLVITVGAAISEAAVPGETIELSVEWGFPNVEEIEGFTIWEATGGEGIPVLIDIPPDARTVKLSAIIGDNGCSKSYYITAHRGDMHSAPSRAADWCPSADIIVRPGQVIQLIIRGES